MRSEKDGISNLLDNLLNVKESKFNIEYDERIDFSSKKFQDSFGLESGKKQLEDILQNVDVRVYDDSLIVTESKPLINYINSTIGNVQEILKDKEEVFRNYLDEKIERYGGIKISKSTGIFIANKF